MRPIPSAVRGPSGRAPGLWQPEHPVFWVMLVGLLVCAPLQLLAFAAQEPSAVSMGVAGLTAAVQLAALWLVARAVSRGRGRPVALRLIALAWGLTVVPVVAVLANSHYFAALRSLGLHSLAASIAAPLDEDLLRAVGVLGVLLLASRERITALDGAIYGVLVGAGFEIAENLIYLLDAHDLDGVVRMSLIRTGIGFGLHALWTGIAGAALAACLARYRAGMPARWWLILLGILGPMALHALWDAPAPSVDPRAKAGVLIAVYAVTLAGFIAAVVLARRSEAAAAVPAAAA
ncbi:PrsW family glutamic-type intramembrane protease [Leucobacter celer]|uniref:PrsW family glutamic-type intramembrane protease n=1 Tax=Leucobacter celer TaxID=668625 RepID=UPI0006A7B7E5|nr:PrsW family glutamic-type intramembrane protease [Leucobacter celer]